MFAGGNVLDVLLMYGPLRSHPLKVPKREAKALHEIIATSTTIEIVIESLNQMMNLKITGTLSSQVVVQYAGKDVESLGEDVTSSDEGIFIRCSINSMVYTLFNNHTKSMMEFIKVFLNDFQTGVVSHEDKDYDLIGHNVEKVVIDNILSNLHLTEV